MNILLNIIFSFYPSVLIWNSIPAQYFSKLEKYKFIVFALIFFGVYIAMKRVISQGYGFGARRGFLHNALTILLAAALILIAFYTILPGESFYHAPLFIKKYLLAPPYSLIALIAPFVYFFFE